MLKAKLNACSTAHARRLGHGACNTAKRNVKRYLFAAAAATAAAARRAGGWLFNYVNYRASGSGIVALPGKGHSSSSSRSSSYLSICWLFGVGVAGCFLFLILYGAGVGGYTQHIYVCIYTHNT